MVPRKRLTDNGVLIVTYIDRILKREWRIWFGKNRSLNIKIHNPISIERFTRKVLVARLFNKNCPLLENKLIYAQCILNFNAFTTK